MRVSAYGAIDCDFSLQGQQLDVGYPTFWKAGPPFCSLLPALRS